MSKTARRHRHSETHDGSHPPHVDEKWLVSYSDMMTLLFGLFVMLYSIALEKVGGQKEFNKIIKEISTKGFQGIKTLEQEKSETKNVYQNEIQRLQTSLHQLEIEKSDLLQKTADLESKLADSSEKLKLADKSALQADLENKLKQKNSDIDLLTKKIEDIQKIKADLDKKIAQLTLDNQALQKRSLASAPANPANVPVPQNTTLLLLAKWEEEKYDIDLELTDSNTGRTYNFKKKKYSGDSTQFVLDAAKGPATELIRIEPKPNSKFTAKVKVYNNRGATQPAVVDIIAMGPDGEKLLMKLNLDSQSLREKSFPLEFNEQGILK